MEDRHWMWRLALPASVVVHVLAVALLIFGLPVSPQKPEKEQVTNVDLVPPPKPPEKKAEPPPAKKPPPEKPKEEKAEAPKPPPSDAIRKLEPVVQFGEKDAGPRKSMEGDSAEESAKPETQEPDKPDQEKPETDKSQPTTMQALAAQDGQAEAALPQTVEPPRPRPSESAKPRKAPRPDEAKRLSSRSATGDPVATTAMANASREARGGTLCVSKLNAQLLSASPPYLADLLPSYPLTDGTVIDARNSAFRVMGQWREISYRCEVDAAVTKVVSFSYRVGKPIPRNEWQRLGLPSR